MLSSCVSPKRLQTQNIEFNNNIENLAIKIKSLEKAIMDSNSTVQNLNEKSNTKFMDQAQTIQSLKRQVSDLENKNKNLRDLISKLRIEVTILKKRIN